MIATIPFGQYLIPCLQTSDQLFKTDLYRLFLLDKIPIFSPYAIRYGDTNFSGELTCFM